MGLGVGELRECPGGKHRHVGGQAAAQRCAQYRAAIVAKRALTNHLGSEWSRPSCSGARQGGMS